MLFGQVKAAVNCIVVFYRGECVGVVVARWHKEVVFIPVVGGKDPRL